MLSLHTAKKKTRPEEVFGGQRCFNSKTWIEINTVYITKDSFIILSFKSSTIYSTPKIELLCNKINLKSKLNIVFRSMLNFQLKAKSYLTLNTYRSHNCGLPMKH